MVDTTLGPCHYSEDMSEQATLMAVLKDGTGWIPICEDHKSDAESDGYTPQEVVDVPDAMEQNKDMPAPEKDTDGDSEDADESDDEAGESEGGEEATDEDEDDKVDDKDDDD
jgi:hypothetical protein